MKLNLPLERRHSNRMAPIGIGVGGAAIGAALVWLLDPNRGARRRAEIRNRAGHAARTASEAADVSVRDIAHRSRGASAGLRGRVSEWRERLRGEPVDDRVLTERVRSRLGRLCSHPGAIEVVARDGTVELRGPILEAEVDQVLRGVSRVRGLEDVEDRLDVHRTPGDNPALQGGIDPGIRQARQDEHWNPATRTLGGAAGTGLIAWAVTRKDLLGAGAGLAGLGLLVRSLTNEPTTRIVGIGAGRRAVDIRKSIYVNAPVEEVFDFFSRLENFPRFMQHVRQVRPLGQNGRQWRWTVDGPAGMRISWDADVTEWIPNRMIAWKSVEGSPIRNAGSVRFESQDGGTRIGIRLSYNPPGGRVGHALSSALGANPRRQLDDDMVRFKSLLETGKATGREETVTKEELVERT